MNEAIAYALLLIGAAFVFIGSLGVLRMPDLYMRMQASAKAATLGAGCVLLGMAVFFGDVSVTSRALLTIIFLFLTAPVAAHMIARAAYIVGVPLWDRTVRDDLKGRYDLHDGVLHSATPEPASGPEPGEEAH